LVCLKKAFNTKDRKVNEGNLEVRGILRDPS
jgi:hypothetical protein